MTSVLSLNGVHITQNMNEWQSLASAYDIAVEEIGLIDFNRLGVCLDDHEVRVDYRARFNGSILYDDDWSWFALPVRDSIDSPFHAKNEHILFDRTPIGYIDIPALDTCDTSYQRGKHLLNLNSRSRSACHGCKACVHNDKNLYDNSVIKDSNELTTREKIEKFFCEKVTSGLDVPGLKQIAVVTGLFKDEADVLRHMQDVYDVAKSFGFKGELMYFGCQIVSHSAIESFAKLGNTAIVFAIDNFAHRQTNLSRIKSALSLDEIYDTMQFAASCGIQTTFAYIAGVDPLSTVQDNFQYFAPICTRFPVVNIFQIQTMLQSQALDPAAKELEYYAKMRKVIERAFMGRDMRPRRWENYRPLWYRTFADENLKPQAYGEGVSKCSFG